MTAEVLKRGGTPLVLSEMKVLLLALCAAIPSPDVHPGARVAEHLEEEDESLRSHEGRASRSERRSRPARRRAPDRPEPRPIRRAAEILPREQAFWIPRTHQRSPTA
jgi:hypothetical protein